MSSGASIGYFQSMSISNSNLMFLTTSFLLLGSPVLLPHINITIRPPSKNNHPHLAYALESYILLGLKHDSGWVTVCSAETEIDGCDVARYCALESNAVIPTSHASSAVHSFYLATPISASGMK
jgi:hypothetical protein